MDALELSVDLLAAYRLTRLATEDVIAEPFRRALVTRSGGKLVTEIDPEGERTALEVVEEMKEPPKIARLVTCRWCSGMWIAGGVVLARAVAPKVWDPVAKALAFSAGAALLAGLEDG